MEKFSCSFYENESGRWPAGETSRSGGSCRVYIRLNEHGFDRCLVDRVRPTFIRSFNVRWRAYDTGEQYALALGAGWILNAKKKKLAGYWPTVIMRTSLEKEIELATSRSGAQILLPLKCMPGDRQQTGTSRAESVVFLCEFIQTVRPVFNSGVPASCSIPQGSQRKLHSFLLTQTTTRVL
jgi:hypothetical protein